MALLNPFRAGPSGHSDLESGKSNKRTHAINSKRSKSGTFIYTSKPSFYWKDEVKTAETKVKFPKDSDVKQILSSIRPHISYRVREEYEMKNLPKFDDLTQYGVSDEQEHDFWKLEVERLAKSATSTPILEGYELWFGHADTGGYNRLHRLSRQILLALEICVHDNELVLLEHHPDLADERRFTSAHQQICNIFDQDRGVIRYERPIRIGRHNDEALHSMINYITAVVLHMLIGSMGGDFWRHNTVSALAKLAAKFKVLTRNLPQALGKTLEAHDEFQARVHATEDIKPDLKPKSDNEDNGAAAKQRAARLDDIDQSGGRYFLEMSTFSDLARRLIKSLLIDLSWNEETQQEANSFETCSIVYETGSPAYPMTHLWQERGGSIGATSDRKALGLSDIAFRICHKIWATRLSGDGSEPCTTLTWCRTLDSGKEMKPAEVFHKTVKMNSMMDVITAMVPFMMFCGTFSSTLSTFIHKIILLSDPENPVKFGEPDVFIALAGMASSANANSQSGSLNTLADTFLTTDIARCVHNNQDFQGIIGQKNNEDMEEVIKQFETWTIDEKSITIQHGWYTFVSMSFCTLIIGGGVVLIALQDRIQGVDPSNLTALAWAAAGFAMVYFKSRRVQDWPWRDFLAGKIVCRSVKEVQSVTGLDPQRFIAAFLRLESKLYLETRGPFNTLFTRKSNDGFSIDVHPRTSTTIYGGFVFIQVDSKSGSGLVALDTRETAGYDLVRPMGSTTHEEGIACRDIFDSWEVFDPWKVKGHKDSTTPVYPLSTQRFEWHRVRGIFAKKAYFH